MNLLLDTHALIWLLEDDVRLGRPARTAISDVANRSYVSDATAWEMGIKSSLRKLACPHLTKSCFPDCWRSWASTSCSFVMSICTEW